MQHWIEQDTRAADFGDQRLDARYRILLNQLSERPSRSIPAACGGLAETTAAYRFFDNDKTTPDKVLAPHRHATLTRIRAERVALVAQDTTEVDLTRRHEKVGGPLTGDSRWGLYAHPLLALTPQRIPLGVVAATLWSRDPKELEKPAAQRKKERRRKPFAAKESHRWLAGYESACQLALEAPDTQVICLSDSEGDIYECLLAGAADEAKRADWIVRANHVDRALAPEDEPDSTALAEAGRQNLLQLLACQAPLGTMTVAVSPRHASLNDERKRQKPRAGRTARVAVRSVRTRLNSPQRSGLPPVEVSAVWVREEHPPAGEEPIDWLLLTSLPVTTFAEASLVASYYACRWEIEVFFRVLKSGCRVEELQLECGDRMQVCLAMYLIVAWRVLYVLKLGRECPEIGSDAVFTEAEWRSIYVIAKQKAAPPSPPTLGELVPLIASLGGYLDRKGDGPPGPQTMWIGLQRLRDFALAWTHFGPATRKKDV